MNSTGISFLRSYTVDFQAVMQISSNSRKPSSGQFGEGGSPRSRIAIGEGGSPRSRIATGKAPEESNCRAFSGWLAITAS